MSDYVEIFPPAPPPEAGAMARLIARHQLGGFINAADGISKAGGQHRMSNAVYRACMALHDAIAEHEADIPADERQEWLGDVWRDIEPQPAQVDIGQWLLSGGELRPVPAGERIQPAVFHPADESWRDDHWRSTDERA